MVSSWEKLEGSHENWGSCCNGGDPSPGWAGSGGTVGPLCAHLLGTGPSMSGPGQGLQVSPAHGGEGLLTLEPNDGAAERVAQGPGGAALPPPPSPPRPPL